MKSIGSLLDDTIEKGERLERKSRIEQYEETLTKSLSHDPFRPHQMNVDSPYHNPYRQLADGSFAPQTLEELEYSGRNLEHYGTVKQFYRDAGVEREIRSERDHQALQASINNRFRSFAKSLDTLSKGEPAPGTQKPKGGVPVGTVHTYSDGQRYRKIAEGKWAPLAGLEKQTASRLLADPKHGPQANATMEAHAGQALKIQEALERKQREQEVVEQAKNAARQETITHMKKIIDKLYDDKPPKEMEKLFKEGIEGAAKEGPHKLDRKPMDGIEPGDKPVTNPAGHAKHSVSVDFQHGGQNYSRQFNVMARTPAEATQRVHEGITQRLGRSVQIGKTKASVMKPEKPKEDSQNG